MNLRMFSAVRCALAGAALLAVSGCTGVTLDVGARLPEPDGRPIPDPGPTSHPPRGRPPVKKAPGPYSHLPLRASFSPRTSVELKEGCYAGDFVLGASQIRVKGAGIGKTVIHGNLVLQTQCTVSGVTVLGDVIFEGHQAELEHSDFFGRVIDNGSQNQY